MNTSARPRVLVSGAGIAGLATAISLQRSGWEPLVVERAASRRRGGHLVNVSGTGYDAAQRLGILPALTERNIDLHELVYVTAAGRRRFSVPGATVTAMLGRRHLTLLRSDLETVLHEAAQDEVEIRFDTRIHTITPRSSGVRALLADGSVVDADLLVGADGVHSGTRALAFGPHERFRTQLGSILVAAFLPPSRLQGVREHAVMMSVPGRTAVVIGLGAGRTAALFTYRSARPEADLMDGPYAALTRAYRGTGWLVPELLAQLRDAESVHFDSASQVRLDRWSVGRIVLLGDAAWCPTLFAGAGASLALAGADRLGTALTRQADVNTALATWEAECRPQVERHQRAGRRHAARHAPNGRLRGWWGELPFRAAALPPLARVLERHVRLHG